MTATPGASKTGRLIEGSLALGVIALTLGNVVHQPLPTPPPASSWPAPLATIDLTTPEGLALVSGQWRYSDTRIVQTDFLAAGADGQPSATPARTYDVSPHAGAREFDDSAWEVIAPSTLADRRTAGLLAFNWYRLRLTVPARIGEVETTGASLLFDASLDDYAEVWVDGELPRLHGQQGGSVVAGWNADNRLVVGRDVQPGQQIQLAVFGINGPISNPPTNYVWVRHARLHLVPGPRGPMAVPPQEVNVEVERVDPRLDRIVPRNPKLHKLAEGFAFTEGPVWRTASHDLLFSDPNRNVIHRYAQRDGLSIFREQSGYDGADVARFHQPGSNGLTLDPDGRVTINEHGRRRVVRLEHDGTLTTLADRYDGRRLNSPNDLVYASDGTLYFTDPPFGLPAGHDDPTRELDFSGVYALRDGVLRLLSKDLRGPNGIALSPDERFLYVGNWDDDHKVVVRYSLRSDGSASAGHVFVDLTSASGEDAIDGVKVDIEGHVYVSGPGGLWIFSPDGEHLGTVRAPRHVHNMAWGDEDGRTLYLCARDRLYRLPLLVPGVLPGPTPDTPRTGQRTEWLP